MLEFFLMANVGKYTRPGSYWYASISSSWRIVETALLFWVLPQLVTVINDPTMWFTTSRCFCLPLPTIKIKIATIGLVILDKMFTTFAIKFILFSAIYISEISIFWGMSHIRGCSSQTLLILFCIGEFTFFGDPFQKKISHSKIVANFRWFFRKGILSKWIRMDWIQVWELISKLPTTCIYTSSLLRDGARPQECWSLRMPHTPSNV